MLATGPATDARAAWLPKLPSGRSIDPSVEDGDGNGGDEGDTKESGEAPGAQRARAAATASGGLVSRRWAKGAGRGRT
jgi:hypothetical protein